MLLLVSIFFVSVNYLSIQKAIDREVSRSFEYRNRIAELSLKKHLTDTGNFIDAIVGEYSRNRTLAGRDLNSLKHTLGDFLSTPSGVYIDLMAIVLPNKSILYDLSSPFLAEEHAFLDTYLTQQQSIDLWQLVLLDSAKHDNASLINSVAVVAEDTGKVEGYVVYGISLKDNTPLTNAVHRDAEVDTIELLIGDQVLAKSFDVNVDNDAENYLNRTKATAFVTNNHALSIRSYMKDSLRQDLDSAYKANLLAVIFVSVLSILVALFLIRRVTSVGFGRLLKYADNLTKNDADAKPYEPSKIVEFDRLGTALEGMMASIKVSDEALRDSERQQRDLLNNTSSIVYIKDLSGRYLFINKKFEQLFNINDHAIRGRYDHEIFPREIAKAFRTNDVKVIEADALLEFEEKSVHEDGEHFYISVKYPLKRTSGETYALCGISTDITERKRSETQLLIAKTEAETANKTKSEFLASMSHELRTPLNAILGFSDILMNQYFGPPGAGKYKEYAQDIHKSGKHLLELVDDLLDISAIEVGQKYIEKEHLSAHDTITECTRIVSEKARSNGLSLTIDIHDELPHLYADKRAAKQILLNLLWNSIKFTPNGGTISVAAISTETHMNIIVSDSGAGISADVLSNITDPYTRPTNGSYIADSGWGLGLSITQSLIELHAGKMDIKSDVGQGTVVTVSFPALENAANVASAH